MKRTQALRGRNLPGIISPKRRSDVGGQRDPAAIASVRAARSLLMLCDVLRTSQGSAGRSGCKTDRNFHQIPCQFPAVTLMRAMPAENPGVRGSAPAYAEHMITARRFRRLSIFHRNRSIRWIWQSGARVVYIFLCESIRCMPFRASGATGKPIHFRMSVPAAWPADA